MNWNCSLPKSAQISVGTTPTLIVAANRADQVINIHNLNSTVYLGDSSVSTSTGFRMDNGDKLQIPLADNEALYGVTATGTSTVYVLVTVN